MSIETLISQANPVPDESVEGPGSLAEQRTYGLVMALVHSERAHGTVWNKWTYTGAGLVATAAAVVLILAVLPGSPVRPQSAAAAVLTQAANAAASEPAVELGPGEYLYTETELTSESDYLDLTKTGQIDVVFNETIQKWVAADGSGREIDTYVGPGRFATPASQENWVAAGQPASVLATPAGPNGGNLETTYGPAVTQASCPCSTTSGQVEPGQLPLDVSKLPTDPTDLLRVIEAGKTGDSNLDEGPGTPGGVSAMASFGSAADLLSQPEVGVTPALRSALYQVMASLPGVELLGAATDRSGQSGTAIAGPTYMGLRYQLIIDPTSGELLEQEQVIVDPSAESAGLQKYAGATAGDVTAWTDYLSSGVVNSLTGVARTSG
jgi:hypothetical protein